MPLLSTAILQIIDSIAIVLGQSNQLARARLASSGSAVLDMLTQRDRYKTELELRCRECDLLCGQGENYLL